MTIVDKFGIALEKALIMIEGKRIKLPAGNDDMCRLACLCWDIVLTEAPHLTMGETWKNSWEKKCKSLIYLVEKIERQAISIS